MQLLTREPNDKQIIQGLQYFSKITNPLFLRDQLYMNISLKIYLKRLKTQPQIKLEMRNG